MGSSWFNRYIVECKYYGVALLEVDCAGFNRYIVECKWHSARVSNTHGVDLIDT